VPISVSHGSKRGRNARTKWERSPGCYNFFEKSETRYSATCFSVLNLFDSIANQAKSTKDHPACVHVNEISPSILRSCGYANQIFEEGRAILYNKNMVDIELRLGDTEGWSSILGYDILSDDAMFLNMDREATAVVRKGMMKWELCWKLRKKTTFATIETSSESAVEHYLPCRNYDI
jgi:hypothetical protein